MVMLVRALIRFHWDETSYNHHWGGESVLALIGEEDNPVVEPFVADTYQDEVDHLLQELPYPDWDKGVAVYAGFDQDGTRGLNFAISRTVPQSVRQLRAALTHDNFDASLDEMATLLSPLITDLRFELATGSTWFRARTGCAARYLRSEGFESQIVRQPFTNKDIGAAPNPGHGRLNRKGQPVLYLGSNPYTALAEIRPHPGHYVSIGGFDTITDLSVADFDPDISLFSGSDERLEMFAVIQAFDRLMSTPVTPDDMTSYLITQLLADVLKTQGYDAIQFRSSVADGVNLCIFDPEKARFVEEFSEVHHIKGLQFDVSNVPSILESETGDMPLDS